MNLQTSDPDIYAVGDAIEFVSPITGKPANTFLAGTANKQGRICANNIVLGNTQKYEGSINTAIAKVFDMTVAVAGVHVKQLKAAGIDHYFNNIQLFTCRILSRRRKNDHSIAFTPHAGKLLSAQVVGYSGVDKRLDL